MLRMDKAKDQRDGQPVVRPVFVYSTRDDKFPQSLCRLYDADPLFATYFDECDRKVQERLGWSPLLRARSGETPQEYEFEPVLVSTQIALTQTFFSRGVMPAAIVGACGGEFSAGYAAGVLNLENTVDLGCRVSEAISRGLGRGKMIAVKATWDQSEKFTKDFGKTAYVAAGVDGGEILISCTTDSFAPLFESLVQKGVPCREAKSDFGLHSPVVDPWKERMMMGPLKSAQNENPKFPIYSGVTGRMLENIDFDLNHWWNVVRQPLNLSALFRRVLADGYSMFLEINSYAVYSGMIERVASECGKKVLLMNPLEMNQRGT